MPEDLGDSRRERAMAAYEQAAGKRLDRLLPPE
jgi:hypothetical protein